MEHQSPAAEGTWEAQKDASAGTAPEPKKVIETSRLRAKYPDRAPVIVDKDPKCSLPELKRKKFLAPEAMTVQDLQKIIIQNFDGIADQDADGRQAATIFLRAGKDSIRGSELIQDVYAKYVNEDGFLYLTYTAEATLG